MKISQIQVNINKKEQNIDSYKIATTITGKYQT